MTGINGLKVENFERVKLIEVNPNSNQFIIKLVGKNKQGKSSFLNGFAVAVGGLKLCPEKPIRDGADEANIEVDLDDLKVVRHFKRKGDGYTTTLKVTAKDGAAYPSPQSVLDALIGKLAFDPFEFSRMDAKAQADFLKGMVDLGIDLAKWDFDYKALYQERTIAGREADRLKASAQSLPKFDGVPDKETPASAIATEYQEAVEVHAREIDRQAVKNEIAAGIPKIDARIAEIERELAQLKHHRTESQKSLDRLNADPKPILPDLAEIKSRMDSIEDTNSKVRANRERSKAIESANEAIKKHKELDKTVADKLAEKETAIRTAKYPVEGLAFEGDILSYNGQPLSQTSSGEMIVLSARIAMALNPKLKVLFIRNATLIDTEGFELLSKLVIDNGYQIWCEYVDTTNEVGIYIENGEVKHD